MTVLIGISVKGEPVAGVVHRPFSKPAGEEVGEEGGLTYWALKGLGTHGFRATPPKPPQATEELRVIITRSHFTDLVQKTVDALQPREVVRMGGCGHKTMMVLEDHVDAYVFPSAGTKKWDSCAVDAIVREAGGLLTDLNGDVLEYSSWENYRNKMGLVVAMNKDTHRAILDKIPQGVKDALYHKSQL